MALSMAISLSDLKLEHFDTLPSFLTDQKVKTAKKKSKSRSAPRSKSRHVDNNNNNNNNNDDKSRKRSSGSSGTGMKSVAKTSKNRQLRCQRRPRKNRTDSEDTKVIIVPEDSGNAEIEAEIALPPPVSFFEAHRFYRQLLNPLPMVHVGMLHRQPMTRENICRLRRYPSLRGMVMKISKQPRVMYNERNILNLEANLRNFNWQVTWKVDQGNCSVVKGLLDKDFDCDVSTCCSQCDFKEPFHSDFSDEEITMH